MEVEIASVAERTDGKPHRPDFDRVGRYWGQLGFRKPEGNGRTNYSARDYRRAESRSQRFVRFGGCENSARPPSQDVGM
jgi:hypothetical protein